MKYFILALILLINFSFAQEIIIKAANSNGNAALFSLSGEKSSFIDSISAINYTYQFNLNSKNSGFYRLVFSNKKWVDFVYDADDIEIEVVKNYRITITLLRSE